MESISLFVLALLAGAGLCALLLRGRPLRAPPPAEADVRTEIRVLAERLHGETASVAQRVEGLDRRMSTAHDSSTRLASSIFDRLGAVDQATQTIAEQAREFVALQDLLRAPQARGGLGEAMLEELLRQVLPPQAYAMQHRFTSGVIVDAIVKAGDRIVCIDSKFPLANYNKMCEASGEIERAQAERDFVADVDRHIRDISTKYIVPDERTFDFAVMYVPAEGVYGEVLRLKHRKQPLFESAMDARVVPMSPLTLYGYLQTVLFGLKCLSIEKNAEAVLGHCGRLQQDIERFASEYETLGRHLGNARSKYEEGARRLDRFRDKLDGVVQLSDDPDEQRVVPPSGDPVSLEVIGE
jgi:DNA recombination protein RmuC